MIGGDDPLPDLDSELERTLQLETAVVEARNVRDNAIQQVAATKRRLDAAEAVCRLVWARRVLVKQLAERAERPEAWESQLTANWKATDEAIDRWLATVPR